MVRFPRSATRYLGKFLTFLLGAALGVGGLSPPVHANQTADVFEAVRKADLDLGLIGWKLAVANAALCDRVEPGLGLQLHTLDQFDASSRESAQKHFKFATAVAVEGVFAGSPAERAGLRPDDSLVRVGSVDIAAIAGRSGTTERLVATQLAIAALPPNAPIEVQALRSGVPVTVTVQPVPACRSRFELRLAQDYNASADGTMVQISARFLETYSQEQVAAAVAHEFSHNILHHRDRLEAKGVDFGLLSGFGANVKYFRETELRADLLSVYLLANAGYPPRASVAFWRSFGPSKAGGIFRSRSHPHWRDRVATLEREIAELEKVSTRPVIPTWLGERDQPLTGNWQALIVRH
ncbi:M48 family metallopeptidase [Sphingomonas psychrotolerans]|uniref:M48 family metallopeptidase n=1 Tax=Sphingomonas psychrotolerans TaxID=1327635 RepID=A0ABU3N5G6_9SPHN|nr:M48 family metallopeptidase [Sphingomonas psychrotolerans]MDT8759708.1 M48 family metallopeptidase [Sphingomonas psychrotolerans]